MAANYSGLLVGIVLGLSVSAQKRYDEACECHVKATIPKMVDYVFRILKRHRPKNAISTQCACHLVLYPKRISPYLLRPWLIRKGRSLGLFWSWREFSLYCILLPLPTSFPP